MTDFAKPTSPGEAVKDIAKTLRHFATDHKRKAQEHMAIAAALDERASEAEDIADRWDKYQPKPDICSCSGGPAINPDCPIHGTEQVRYPNE